MSSSVHIQRPLIADHLIESRQIENKLKKKLDNLIQKRSILESELFHLEKANSNLPSPAQTVSSGPKNGQKGKMKAPTP